MHPSIARSFLALMTLAALVAPGVPAATAQVPSGPAVADAADVTEPEAAAGVQASTQPTGAAAIPTAGLLGHWPLDGNALDTSGHGRNGTIVGATPTTGVKGGAFAFDGSAHIDLPNFQFPNSTYTVSIWMETTQPIAPVDMSVMFSQLDGPAGSGPFELAVGQQAGGFSNFGPMFNAWSSGAGLFVNLNVPQINPRDGRWHMLTGTYRNGLQQLFVDGAFIKSSHFAGPLPTISAGAHIGGQNFGPFHHPWVGRLDEAAIYDTVLSTVQILRLYQATNPPPKAT